MQGPLPQFDTIPANDYQMLQVGKRYQIIRSFLDRAGRWHPVGETWVFLGHSYHVADLNLRLYVTEDENESRHFDLVAGSRGKVVKQLSAYILEH